MAEVSESTSDIFRYVRSKTGVSAYRIHDEYDLTKQGYSLLENSGVSVKWKYLRKAILIGLENGAKPKDLIQAILDDRQKDD